MSDVIKLLPDSVANQIAAGEVIQRPASVVKELVENAVDAGASNIKIILKDAGRTLIQVVDNGSGMSPTDARLAFERHSTSKISAAADLFSLHTMGFRGEALASICAISQVDLRTMRHDDTIGTRIAISGSQVETQEPEVCAPGCNMMVKNLFFNVPARRKFLKSDHVEMNNILREFERLALVNPNVEFTLIHNDITLYQLLKSPFKQRIIDLFGKSLDKQLVPIATDTSLVHIDGFVSRPEHARKRGMLQYFMVNGRNMRHPYFHKAVMHCYEQLIAPDEQPSYFINFTVDPETIDVNIHPTKNEIKFENEQPIWQIITAVIKEGLGKFNAVPSIDFDREDAPEIPTFNPDSTADHGLNLDLSYNPFDSKPTAPRQSGGGEWKSSRLNAATQDWEKLYADFERNRDESLASMRESALNNLDADADGNDSIYVPQTASATLDINTDVAAPVTLQMKGRYILSPSKSGLMVIDQHRAHVRILYDRYLSMTSTDNMATQRVIFPEVIELTPAEQVVMDSIVDDVNRMGFDIAYLGDNSWSVNGVPSVVHDSNPRELVMAMVDNVVETTGDVSTDLKQRVALSMAKASAIKAGQTLSPSEMDRLLSDLFALSTPNYTPDGKLVVSIIAIEDIEHLFA